MNEEKGKQIEREKKEKNGGKLKERVKKETKYRNNREIDDVIKKAIKLFLLALFKSVLLQHKIIRKMMFTFVFCTGTSKYFLVSKYFSEAQKHENNFYQKADTNRSA